MSRFKPALAVVILLAFGCSSMPSELELFDGTFDYVALDENGAAVLEGCLVLDAQQGGSVTGSCQIDWVAGADRKTPVGPQVGSGFLVGAISDGEITSSSIPELMTTTSACWVRGTDRASAARGRT